jgi:hypothetical protein
MIVSLDGSPWRTHLVTHGFAPLQDDSTVPTRLRFFLVPPYTFTPVKSSGSLAALTKEHTLALPDLVHLSQGPENS